MSISNSPSPPEQHWTDAPEAHLPEDHWPLPEIILVDDEPTPQPEPEAFVSVMNSPEYDRLRSTFRGFAFPMTIAGLSSYFVYVLLSVYAVEFMSRPLIGSLNIGLTLGLAQFGVTWIWTYIYVRFANSRLDPASEKLRNRLEGGAA